MKSVGKGCGFFCLKDLELVDVKFKALPYSQLALIRADSSWNLTVKAYPSQKFT